MRTILLALVVLSTAFAISAQDIVTKRGQRKSVVLEEFTGLNCTFCPDGHRRAKMIQDAYPGRVVLLNVHAGVFATPSGNQPDYRTSEGIELDNYVGVGGYPSGTVNRRTFDGDLDYSRTSWAGYSDIILEETTPVNVGARSEYDESTRTLTVYTEVFYTQNAPAPTNRLIIALLQDNIEGPQVGAQRNPDDVLPNGLYNHSNMLRDFMYGAFGKEIPQTSSGTLYRDTLVYQLPLDVRNVPVVADDCHVAIYVANDEENIQTGIDIGLNDENDGNNSPITIAVDEVTELAKNATTSGEARFNTTFYPFIAGDSDYDLKIDKTDSPDDWTVEYTLNGPLYTDDQTLTLTDGNDQNFELIVNPTSPGVGRYRVTMTPLAFPETEVSFEVAVIHEVSNLIVNGESTLGDGTGTARRFGDIYTQAFQESGIADADDIDANQFLYLASSNSLDGVNNLYMNIGWSFPAMTTEMTLAFINFMDGGGNLFLAGQDVAWDISENSGNPSTRLFLSGYLKAAYVDDGNAANNPVTGAEDGIFSDFEDFTLFDFYGGGNFYPDQILPIGGSSAALVYGGDESRIGGVYFDSGVYKMVYMGFGLEMVKDATVRAQLMNRVHDFFEGTLNNEEQAQLEQIVRVYPNPVQGGTLNIELDVEAGQYMQLKLTDASGRAIRDIELNSGQSHTIDVSGMSSGIYFLQGADGTALGTTPIHITGE